MIAVWPDGGEWIETAADRDMRLFLQGLDPEVVQAERHVNFTGTEKRILDAKTKAARPGPVGFFFTQNQLDAAAEAAERRP
ncbi:hypothetical protein [Mycetocola spongiae]|uniref:hypothetical protein n=1 Tax=Mycetocola spongiae TaxID=2859226 RepID=UPI001CF2AD64|nr:hypothetical protein [Mycetocola spongiae]UCR89271.1 hypothetical protein KXZ72_00720 [Mycetocola spongiae]